MLVNDMELVPRMNPAILIADDDGNSTEDIDAIEPTASIDPLTSSPILQFDEMLPLPVAIAPCENTNIPVDDADAKPAHVSDDAKSAIDRAAIDAVAETLNSP